MCVTRCEIKELGSSVFGLAIKQRWSAIFDQGSWRGGSRCKSSENGEAGSAHWFIRWKEGTVAATLVQTRLRNA